MEVNGTMVGDFLNTTSMFVDTLGPSEVFCAAIWSPVCGEDGKTYGNECSAKAAGTDVLYKGKCNDWEDFINSDNLLYAIIGAGVLLLLLIVCLCCLCRKKNCCCCKKKGQVGYHPSYGDNGAFTTQV